MKPGRCAICFAVFWGTIFPVISEWVRGVKITVGPPFFNQVNGPLSLALLLTLGIGPVIAWRRASRHNLERNFRLPLIVLLAAGVIAVALGLRLTGVEKKLDEADELDI